MTAAVFHLRPYRADDEDAAIALWLKTWQQAYPSIDFAARVPWWRARWRDELVPNAAIIVAEEAGELVGFVTIDAKGYLDQLVVSPDRWGSVTCHTAGRRGKTAFARPHHAIGQHRQRPGDPFLRAQWLC